MATTLVEQYHYDQDHRDKNKLSTTDHHDKTDGSKPLGIAHAAEPVMNDAELAQYSSKLVANAFRERINNETAEHDLEDGEEESFDAEDSFFVADLGVIYRQYVRWIRHLPRIKPLYAIKCNGDEKVVELFAKLGMGFDCASMKEMQMVLDHGVDPHKIVYANPCKTPSYLRYARQKQVDMMTFDNADELYKCKNYYPHAKLLLRIMTDDSNALCRLSVKFGASLEDSYKLLDLAHGLGLNVTGVAFHVGSGAADTRSFVQAVEHSRLLFDYAKDKHGQVMDMLDVGGGFENETFEATAAVLNQALEMYFSDPAVQIVAEPGRFFVATGFSLAASVIGRRVIQATDEDDRESAMIYLTDGVYGSLNCIMFDHQHPTPRILQSNGQFLHGTELNHEGAYQCSIWGPTCDGLDCVTESCHLPLSVQIGDWLYFDNVGAYTSSASTQFNGFNTNCQVVYVSSDPVVREYVDL